MQIKSNKWIDGKVQTLWPIIQHLGWSVQTAGVVELDLIEPKSGSYNYGPHRILPPKTIVILKHIDDKGKAFVYNHEDGVMMMPVELLEPVGK
jgi:hypothetical protein